MRKITVPTRIVLTDPVSGRPGQTLSFRDYVYSHWFNDQRWSNPLTNLDIFLKCKHEIDKPEGEEMVFEDADLAFLADVVRSVPHEPAPIYIQLKGFDDAILSAR